jgi:hypothetical protein
MDDARFDRLTRRFVLGGLGGGSLAALLGFDEAETKKRKGAKRKRCRKKKRRFCAGRCCPKRQRCENKTCVASCDNPGTCFPVDLPGGPCSGSDDCFCTTAIGGDTICAALPPGPDCQNLEECGADQSCPAGRICGLCTCLGPVGILRCLLPCPAG